MFKLNNEEFAKCIAFTEQVLIESPERKCSKCTKPIPEDYTPILLFSGDGHLLYQFHDECFQDLLVKEIGLRGT